MVSNASFMQSLGNKENTQLYSFLPSFSDSKGIQDKLADRFKDGTIFLDDGDLTRFIVFFLVAVAFFAFNSAFWYKLFSSI